jgi:hypothetical protein
MWRNTIANFPVPAIIAPDSKQTASVSSPQRTIVAPKGHSFADPVAVTPQFKMAPVRDAQIGRSA